MRTVPVAFIFLALANSLCSTLAFIPLQFTFFGFDIGSLIGIFLNYNQCLGNNIYNERTRGYLARRTDYTKIRIPAEEVISTMRINNAGPAALQGLFWVDVPEILAEVASFARTEEGGGLSSGTLSDMNPAYRIRQFGDKVWAGSNFPTEQGSILDITLNWILIEGTPADPQKFKINLDIVLPGTCIRYTTGDCPGLVWNMTLSHTPYSGDAFPSHPQYGPSVVWSRDSGGAFSFDYRVIQIVNGAGGILEPAYSDFLQDINSGNGFVTTNELNPDPSPPRCSAEVPWWCFFCQWLAIS